MKAIVWTKYGPPEVLQLMEVEKPVPKENEILIRIYATTVTAGDCEQRSLKFHPIFSIPMRIYVGLIKPTRITILGQELAGEVEMVGNGVRRFRKGDQVFGTTGFSFGAYAEYKCLPEDGLVTTNPVNLTYEEAVAVPLGGLEALHYLRKGNIQNGERVLINGAGGSIGTVALQLAKNFGAEVTAVDSTGKLDMLQSIGADKVIDYTREDFTRNGQTYDVIFDVVGKSPLSRSMRSLKQNGRYLTANPGLQEMIRGPWISRSSSRKIISGSANSTTGDLIFLKELLEAERIKPVIDRSFPLEQIVEAHRYAEHGGKLGNLVITVGT